MSNRSRITDAAAALLRAVDERQDREPLTDDWPELDVATAYEIQDAALQMRLDRGEHLIGVKLGLTSVAKQQRMGIDSPLTAWLTDRMILPTGVDIPQEDLIHPRAEPEIVFLMGRTISGPAMTAARALDAVASVHAGVELIDSRFRDFRFTLPDVVADNASASYFVTGLLARSPMDLDLALEACLVEQDGDVVDSATGAAVQGHPAEALALAANSLASRGHEIEAGWLVLTGGMTDAHHVAPGVRTRVSFTNLGAITVRSDAA